MNETNLNYEELTLIWQALGIYAEEKREYKEILEKEIEINKENERILGIKLETIKECKKTINKLNDEIKTLNETRNKITKIKQIYE